MSTSDNRLDIFTKNFKWLYRNFHGSFDINQNPELFNDSVMAYLDMSKSLPTDRIYDFCRYVASIQRELPMMIQWNEMIYNFIKKPEPPKEKKSTKEEIEVALQCDIVMGFWPLLSSLEGRTKIARIYAYTCYKNGLDLPDYWKKHLVYAPLSRLSKDYFDMKPFTKKELKVMGEMIDAKGKDANGRPITVGKKVGRIVGGFFARERNKRWKFKKMEER